VEFFADNDIQAEATDERFSVIRRIGKAEPTLPTANRHHMHRYGVSSDASDNELEILGFPTKRSGD
jgi:hypothetical protein